MTKRWVVFPSMINSPGISTHFSLVQGVPHPQQLITKTEVILLMTDREELSSQLLDWQTTNCQLLC